MPASRRFQESHLLQLLILLALTVTVLLLSQGRLTLFRKRLANYLKSLAAVLGLLVVLYLTATGRLNWLLAAIGIGLAYLLRILPILLNYAPHLAQLWTRFNTDKQKPQNAHASGKMSAEEAYQILGLDAGATEEAIIAAHRRLMQKNHPDRGGSDYLATKINLAKKTLLNR